jgi:hypothetical protein
MLLADPTHPVLSQLTATPIGTPIDLGNGTFCQECQIAGTVTYRPCNACSPQTEYVSHRVCLPCSSATAPTLTIGTVVASPKPITVYQRNGQCGCCQSTCPSRRPLLDWVRLAKNRVGGIIRARNAKK